MTKEPDKQVWETNYQNKSVSGIEIRDNNGRVVHFIAIRHDEALHDIKSHRIAIKLDENDHPILPPAQTFEEIIQAKRRQQMLLYGSGATSSNIATNGTVARRRAAAATKRAKANLSRRPVPVTVTGTRQQAASQQQQQTSGSTSVRGNVSSNGTTKRSHKKKTKAPARPKVPTAAPASASLQAPTKVPPESILTDSFQCEETLVNSSFDTQVSTNSDSISVLEPASSSSLPIVTSMKDLNKNNPLLSSMDPKEVKQMVRSAPPGTSIILPNGTVIRKSRRGGARAGAGRKRSRPLPPGPAP